jgi:hypothetical protein
VGQKKEVGKSGRDDAYKWGRNAANKGHPYEEGKRKEDKANANNWPPYQEYAEDYPHIMRNSSPV